MNRVVSVPVLVGAASRLGLRKPTGVYVYRSGAIRDEIQLWRRIDEAAIRENVRRMADAVGVRIEPWQLDWAAKVAGLRRP